MPAISKDDYILLLFACIRNCKGEGQIDWKGVAQDTNLTANAAYAHHLPSLTVIPDTLP
jgi:hypothetical protein